MKGWCTYIFCLKISNGRICHHFDDISLTFFVCDHLYLEGALWANVCGMVLLVKKTRWPIGCHFYDILITFLYVFMCNCKAFFHLLPITCQTVGDMYMYRFAIIIWLVSNCARLNLRYFIFLIFIITISKIKMMHVKQIIYNYRLLMRLIHVFIDPMKVYWQKTEKFLWIILLKLQIRSLHFLLPLFVYVNSTINRSVNEIYLNFQTEVQ